MSNRSDVAEELRELNSALVSATAIQAVDLLTDEEVEELRAATAHAADEAWLSDRAAASIRARGMYLQFVDSGLAIGHTDLGGTLHIVSIDPKAWWAIGRHDKVAEVERRRLEAAEKAEKDRWRRDVILTVISTVIGGVLAIIGGLLS